jgi:hypothetical protein
MLLPLLYEVPLPSAAVFQSTNRYPSLVACGKVAERIFQFASNVITSSGVLVKEMMFSPLSKDVFCSFHSHPSGTWFTISVPYGTTPPFPSK